MADICKRSHGFVLDTLKQLPAGFKVLVCDEETLKMLTLVVAFSELLKLEVYAVERLANLEVTQTDEGSAEDLYKHVDAVVYIRPTASSILELAKEVKRPQFRKYHVIFSGPVPQSQVDRLARCDLKERIVTLGYGHADYMALGPRLATLGVDCFAPFLQSRPADWQAAETSTMQRVIDGLFSLASSFFGDELPVIRFVSGSVVSEHVAFHVNEKFAAVGGLQPRSSRPGTILLFDRREDPVTPLLNQWTYHAMVNELLGLENNKTKDQEGNEYSLCRADDAFFNAHAVSNFGEMAEAVAAKVSEYKGKSHGELKSVEDVRSFMSHLPEFKEHAGTIVKHVAIMHALTKIVDESHLFRVSEVEQAIACSENRNEHLKQLESLLDSPAPAFEKFRVALLFFLRYEPTGETAASVRSRLVSIGVEDEQIQLIDALLDFAGSRRRTHDIFSNKGLLVATKNRVVRQLQGVANVYTEHKSFLHTLVSRLVKRGVPFDELASTNPNADDSASRVLVFILGGATLEESRDLESISDDIVLGGTTLLTSKKFLADVGTLLLRKPAASTVVNVDAYTAESPEWEESVFKRVKSQGHVFSKTRI